MKTTICGLLTVVAATLLTSTAGAHQGASRTVDASATPDGVTLEIRADASEAAIATGFGPDMASEIRAGRGEDVGAWAVHGIEVRADEPCDKTFGEPRLEDGSVVVDMTAHCGPGERAIMDVSLEDGHQTLVAVDDGDGGKATVILSHPDDAASVSKPVTMVEAARAFVVQGAIHLVTGFDHMLFVLSLLFAAGLVAREQGTKKALRSVTWIITAFTVGHSITLVVASIGWVSLPSQLVEATIAASIIVVCAMNIFKPDATLGRAHVAFGFGLIHGFGFSSVLAEVGLPAKQHAVALFSFNVGIELAQLAFVCIALLPLAWLARQKFYERVVMQGGSMAVAACAAYWLVERVLGA